MRTTLALALALAAAIAAAAFALQTTLPLPGPGARLAAHVVGRLERLARVDTLIRLPGGRTVAGRCAAAGHGDRIRLPDGRVLLVAGTHVRLAAGPRQAPSTTALEADLALCPVLLANELTADLLAGGPVEAAARRIRGRPALIVRAGTRPELVLAVRRPSLDPLALAVRDHGLVARSRVVAIRVRRRAAAVAAGPIG